jgi:uridylate kinase
MQQRIPYKRLLFKLSGELLRGSQPFGIHHEACLEIAKCIKALKESGLEICLVIGGGNIFRGINLKKEGFQRTPADQMGMLATLMNGLALQQALEAIHCPSKVLSALECPRVAETYTWNKALEYLSQAQVMIFVGGTGNPYFTTDTAAALRASEIHADILLKATKVDGVYDKDPLKHSDAKKYTSISYTQFLAEKLEVMDATSVALCRSNKIPILVFNMQLLGQGKILELLKTRDHGTLIRSSI